MKVVNRQAFLALPAGTIFGKLPLAKDDLQALDCDEMAIKGETIGRDFVVQDLFPWFEGAMDSRQWSDVFGAMIRGEAEPALDYECNSRDGLFDDDQMFLVWSKEDASRLVARLQQALTDGYR